MTLKRRTLDEAVTLGGREREWTWCYETRIASSWEVVKKRMKTNLHRNRGQTGERNVIDLQRGYLFELTRLFKGSPLQM